MKDSPQSLALSLVADPKNMSSLAKRICVPRMTGRLSADNQAKMDYNAFVMIVDTLSKEKSLDMPMYGYLVELLQQEKAKAAFDEFDNISTLGRLDTEWASNFITKHSKWTDMDCARIKESDPIAL